jgi:predicted choloylglycine hydrolase
MGRVSPEPQGPATEPAPAAGVAPDPYDFAAGTPREVTVAFRSIVEWQPGERLAAAFEASRPGYGRWFLRDGEAARPTYAACAAALRRHMPELEPTYERLVQLTGGGDLEARFLSLWNPPPIFAACSIAAWTGAGGPALVRNYDYVPTLCDATLLASDWSGARVLAMTDCLWGVLDGVNEHGLAVALAFGGRRVVGDGFAVSLILRYALELCRDVAEAAEAIGRIPVNLAYNVGLVDRAGNAAIVQIGPDRAPVVTPARTCANRQGATEWAEHAQATDTVVREAALDALVGDSAVTLPALEVAFTAPPLYRPTAAQAWGTVYTAAYDCVDPGVRLRWPDDVWEVRLAAPVEEQRPRTMTMMTPPTPVVAGHVVGGAQMIFA